MAFLKGQRVKGSKKFNHAFRTIANRFVKLTGQDCVTGTVIQADKNYRGFQWPYIIVRIDGNKVGKQYDSEYWEPL